MQSPPVTLADIAAVTALIVGVVTYIMTTKRDKDIRRSELVRAFTNDFYQNDDVTQLFADIDYSRFSFVNDEHTWLSQKPETVVVRMLDLFNSLGHNWVRGILKLEDIHGTTLGYAILRAYECPQMRDYVQHVQRYDQSHLGTGIPFQFYQELGEALRVRSAATRARNAGRPALVDGSAVISEFPPRLQVDTTEATLPGEQLAE